MVVDALGLLFSAEVAVVIILSAMLGVLLGSIPGLTALMAVVLLVPFTFYMEPVTAASAIISASAMAMYAGDISGATVRMPGTPASAAYVEDSYALGKRGRANTSLGAALIASVVGGIIGSLMLMFLAPRLARIAYYFSSDEYFWLAIAGLSMTIVISGSRPILGMYSVITGLALSTIGLSVVGGYPRYTFGSVDLLGGIPLIPALIGFFAIPEIARACIGKGEAGAFVQIKGSLLIEGIRQYRKNILAAVRSSTIGVIVGAVPGAGSDIAAWISSGIARRVSKAPQESDDAKITNVVCGSSANNSALAGAWIPALVFGIPGDAITAIVIGVLYIQGIRPGPYVFDQHGVEVLAIFLVFLIANFLLLPFGAVAVRAAGIVLRSPKYLVVTVVFLCSIMGAYADNNSAFGVLVMAGFGLLGWVFTRFEIPVAPAILGLILGGSIEQYFVASMQKYGGNPIMFLSRPASQTIVFFIALVIVASIVQQLLRKKHANFENRGNTE